MKNKKFFAIISLLLALVMVLSSCQPAGDIVEDTPVTAEAKLQNFIELKSPDDDVLDKVELISDTYGKLIDVYEDLALFHDEAKDKLNNLTETYTLYSISEAKSLLEIKNSYPDEYGWVNDFGHRTYPEKLVNDARLEVCRVGDNAFAYLAVEWEARTAIDEETVKNDDLAESYIVKDYCEFYDATGALIATSSVANDGDIKAYSDDFTLVSFGKTVAIFDEDGKVTKTYDGDVEAAPVVYMHENDRYNYLMIPSGLIDSSMMSRFKLEVYDKSGNLVREYINGDYATTAGMFVLEDGDVLIQHNKLTENIDFDYSLGEEFLFNLDTFILDVETGVVTELPDFGYLLQDVIFAEDFDDSIVEGFVATENVRNVAIGATDIETQEECTIFFDNFGTVNYVFEYDINREMSKNDRVIKVLNDGYMLVEVSSGVTDRAVINADSFMAYVPNGATVLEDYIIAGDIRLNLKMERLGEVNMVDLDDYDIVDAPITFGNCIAYNVTDINDPGDGSAPTIVKSVVIYNAEHNISDIYRNCTVEADYSEVEGMGDYVIMHKVADNQNNYVLVNANGNTVFTTPNCLSIRVENAEDAVFVEVDGERTFIISENSIVDEEEVKE